MLEEREKKRGHERRERENGKEVVCSEATNFRILRKR